MAEKKAAKSSKASKSAKGPKKGYRVIKKRSGRFAIMKGGKYVNGADKVAILLQEGLIKAMKPKAKAAE
ncbi:MAG: hypothetical protein NTX25_15660 [Proteobacteria bacterium]|nr:hypothetical protein [Pseudomonadota bacterium]